MQHLRTARLQHLRASLQDHAFEWDDAPLAAALSELHSAARELRFTALHQGWMARILGRNRAGDARFIAAGEHILACASQLKAGMHALAGSGREPLAAMQG